MKRVIYWLVTRYLKLLSKMQLWKNNQAVVIGITGSAGKTSMMKAVEAVLKDSFKVKISTKANSEIGIPLNILGFKGRNYGMIDWIWILPWALVKLLTNFKKYDVYVVEMGIDSPNPPKNMDYLLSIVRPKIGVFINALSVHGEGFSKMIGDIQDNIAKEKGKLISSLPENGVAVLNVNDKRVISFKDKTKARVVEFDKVVVKIPGVILDEHYSQVFAGALAVAKVFKISEKTAIINIKKNFKLPPGRMTRIKGIKNTLLLDSSYNASRKPVISALKVLDKVGKKKPKIAVLGDMRELGRDTEKEHELVAIKAVETANRLVLVGPLMKKYFLPKVLNLGFPKKNIYWFDNTYSALKALQSKIIEGEEIILIKASQNSLFFEIIVKGLMKDKDKAGDLLCRQTNFWEKKRKLLQL